MFTGIIEGSGKIKSIEQNIYTILHPFNASFEIGESVALSGMCTTVLTSTDDQFTVEVIDESRRCTNFDTVKVGDKLNLERSAMIGQRNSGHNVQGHVDETGEIVGIKKQGDYWCVRTKVSQKNTKLIVLKGSIALNGVSLTVSGVGDNWFEVSIISHTWEETNISELEKGDLVNIEYDITGKYILKMLQTSRGE